MILKPELLQHVTQLVDVVSRTPQFQAVATDERTDKTRFASLDEFTATHKTMVDRQGRRLNWADPIACRRTDDHGIAVPEADRPSEPAPGPDAGLRPVDPDEWEFVDNDDEEDPVILGPFVTSEDLIRSQEKRGVDELVAPRSIPSRVAGAAATRGPPSAWECRPPSSSRGDGQRPSAPLALTDREKKAFQIVVAEHPDMMMLEDRGSSDSDQDVENIKPRPGILSGARR
jgi:hypothetical protein